MRSENKPRICWNWCGPRSASRMRTLCNRPISVASSIVVSVVPNALQLRHRFSAGSKATCWQLGHTRSSATPPCVTPQPRCRETVGSDLIRPHFHSSGGLLLLVVFVAPLLGFATLFGRLALIFSNHYHGAVWLLDLDVGLSHDVTDHFHAVIALLAQHHHFAHPIVLVHNRDFTALVHDELALSQRVIGRFADRCATLHDDRLILKIDTALDRLGAHHTPNTGGRAVDPTRRDIERLFTNRDDLLILLAGLRI